MGFADIGVVVLLAMVGAVLFGVAGLVLFIVGLVNKKPRQWAAGIVLCAATMAMAVGAVVFGYIATTRAVSAQFAALTAQLTTSTWDFESETYVILPADAVTTDVSETSVVGEDGACTNVKWQKIQIPDSFAATLDSAFDPDAWSHVKKYLAHADIVSHPAWGLADSRHMLYYTVNIPDFIAASPDGTVPARIDVSTPVYVAYDRAAGLVCVALVKDLDMSTPDPTGPDDLAPIAEP